VLSAGKHDRRPSYTHYTIYVTKINQFDNFISQKCFKFSWKLLFFTVNYVTLIIMSRKYFVGFSIVSEIHTFLCFLSRFRSPHLTLDIQSIIYNLYGVEAPLYNSISEGMPPLCITSSEAGRMPLNLMYVSKKQNDSSLKF